MASGWYCVMCLAEHLLVISAPMVTSRFSAVLGLILAAEDGEWGGTV
jgi:hypothetical protein